MQAVSWNITVDHNSYDFILLVSCLRSVSYSPGCRVLQKIMGFTNGAGDGCFEVVSRLSHVEENSGQENGSLTV